jgi:hypothetical protein
MPDADQEVPHLDRMVDEFGVVRRSISTELVSACAGARHRRSNPPVAALRVFRWLDFEAALRILLADDRGKDAGAIEETVGRIEMGAAHAQVPGVDCCRHRQRRLAGAGDPRPLVRFFQADGLTVAGRFDRHDVSRHIANQVAARHPGRKGKRLSARLRLDHGHGDFEQSRLGIRCADSVLVRCRHVRMLLVRPWVRPVAASESPRACSGRCLPRSSRCDRSAH